MRALQGLLTALFVSLLAYTVITIANDGINLFAVFFGDMADFEWPGQFNFDFSGFLILSALWTAWRNDFEPRRMWLAVLAFFGGILFLSAYLLYLTTRGGVEDPVTLLVGDRPPATPA